jgi:hypothetical protein
MAGKKNMATTHRTARTASSHPIRLKIIEVSHGDYNARILTVAGDSRTLSQCLCKLVGLRSLEPTNFRFHLTDGIAGWENCCGTLTPENSAAFLGTVVPSEASVSLYSALEDPHDIPLLRGNRLGLVA